LPAVGHIPIRIDAVGAIASGGNVARVAHILTRIDAVSATTSGGHVALIGHIPTRIDAEGIILKGAYGTCVGHIPQPTDSGGASPSGGYVARVAHIIRTDSGGVIRSGGYIGAIGYIPIRIDGDEIAIYDGNCATADGIIPGTCDDGSSNRPGNGKVSSAVVPAEHEAAGALAVHWANASGIAPAKVSRQAPIKIYRFIMQLPLIFIQYI
jgi:hypothetical protein